MTDFKPSFLIKLIAQIGHKLNMYKNNLETTKSLKLPGVEIDHQLRFNQHTSTLCSKAAKQLNALTRL